MLSLANSLSSISSALLDIVKSGLQAWYKADNTQAPLGEEEIIDGDFSPTSPNAPNFNAWTKQSNWTISGGYATSDGSAAGNLDQTALVNGRRYTVKLTVSNMTTSTLSVRLGGTNEVGNINENGQYTFYGTANSTVFRIRSASGFDGSVDNISVKEIVNSVKDFSPNNNNGVLYSGKALSFDGSNDKIDFGNPGYSMKTVAFWINVADVTSNTEQLMEFQTSNGLSSVDGTITTDGTWTGKVTYVDGVAGTSLTAGNWHRVVLTTTAAITVNDFVVGYDDSNYGDFDIADLQIYDSVWSASDVTYDYNNPDKDVFDNSNSSITTTDCKALYRLNEGAGDRVYNAAPVLGEELIVGGVSSTGSWGLAYPDTTVSVVDGILRVSPSSAGAYGVRQTLTTKVGAVYKITATVNMDNASSGSGNLKISNDSNLGTGTTLISSSGSIEAFYTATNATTYIGVADGYNAGAYMEINAISVKQITLPESYVQNSWVSGNWITAQPYIPQYAMSSYSKKAIFGGAGSGDLIDCGKEDSIDNIFVGGGTWSVWVSGVSASGDKGTILSKSQPRLRVRDDDGDDITLEFLHIFSGTNGAWRPPTTALLENKLNHVVVTYNNDDTANDPKIYINGVEQSLDYQTTPTGSAEIDAGSDFRIGSTNSTTDPFDGFIDEVAVFDKILTEAEVQEIFNAGIALDCRDHSTYLGSELVTDTDLNDSTYWTREDTYTTGTFVFSDNGLNIDSSKNVTGTDDNTEYIYRSSFGTSQYDVVSITFTITNYVSGQFRVYIGSSSGSTAVSGNGTYTFTDTADTDQVLYLQSKDNFIGTISSISVKKVDLKGYWRNNGSDTWTDLSGYGNNGTVNGSPTTIQLQEVPYFKKDTFGLPMNKVREKGLNLDGGSYVTIDDSSDFDFGTTGFTIQAWVKPFSLTANDRIITKGKTSDDEWMISVGADNASVRVYAQDSSTAVLDSENTFSTLSLNNWAMITVVIDTPNDQILFYKDDGNVESKTGASWSGNFNGDDSLIIAANKDLDADRFDGIIDDVKIYNRVLSSSEIERNYKVTKSKHISTSNWSDDFDSSFI